MGQGDGAPQTFEVEFEFYDPEESDFHSVRELLCTGSLGLADLDFSGLADTIVEQVNIGTMIKSGTGDEEEEEEDAEKDAALCGLLTVLNLHQFSEKGWCQTLMAFLQEKVKSCSVTTAEQLKAFLKATQPGLLVSERFVNLPLELIPMLHKAVLEDIHWSQTTEHCPAEACWEKPCVAEPSFPFFIKNLCSESPRGSFASLQERPFYFFTHFLLLAKCQPACSSGNEGGPSESVAGEHAAFFLSARKEGDSFGAKTFLKTGKLEECAWKAAASSSRARRTELRGGGRAFFGGRALPFLRA